MGKVKGWLLANVWPSARVLLLGLVAGAAERLGAWALEAVAPKPSGSSSTRKGRSHVPTPPSLPNGDPSERGNG